MKVLVADDDPEIVEIVSFLVKDHIASNVEVVSAGSGSLAIKALSNKDIDFCICDHNMPSGNGNTVLKYITSEQLTTRFVLSSGQDSEQDADLYPAEKVFFRINKPDIFSGVELLAGVIKAQFDLADFNILPTSAAAKEYIPISLYLLTLLGTAPDDLYIKMSEDKFIKCIKKNETFTNFDRSKYNARKIKTLYMEKSGDRLASSSMLAVLINSIMNKEQLPLDQKLNMAHTQIYELINTAGVTQEVSEATQENIKSSVALIMKNDVLSDFWTKLTLIGDYPAQLYTMHSMLASAVVKQLDWSTESTLFKLTMAAFLQDVGLNSIPLMQLTDHNDFLKHRENFNEREVEEYLSHPTKAFEAVCKFKSIPPDIDRIVLEQHEMPKGNGFPRKLSASNIGALSCIFILTGIWARHILEKREQFNLETFIDEVEAQGYGKGNFRDTLFVMKQMLASMQNSKSE